MEARTPPRYAAFPDSCPHQLSAIAQGAGRHGEPLSTDLRKRVVDAVNGGMSRRQAAAHFKVGASSAIRWVAQSLATGDVTPKRQGGDRRSMAIEAQGGFHPFPARTPRETPRIAEMRGVLLAAGPFVQHLGAFALLRPKRRHAQKKSAHATEQDRPDILKRRRAWFDPDSILIRRSSFSSTRPGPPRTWREDAVALPKGNACAPRSLTAIGKRRLSWPH